MQIKTSKSMKTKPKVISLFSGAGGMDIGFERAGFEIAVAVEADPACCETLRANKSNLSLIEGDISKISTEEILSKANLEPLQPALVIGGPPCQSFSLAGKRMGMDDSRGMLLLEFIRVVKESLPVAFVMENVKGMLNWEKGKAIEAVINEFQDSIKFNGNDITYDVSYKVLNAVDFGVSQKRERLFIIGNRTNKVFDFPEATHGENDLARFNLKPIQSSWDAIGKLPTAEQPSATALLVSKSIKGRIAKHGY